MIKILGRVKSRLGASSYGIEQYERTNLNLTRLMSALPAQKDVKTPASVDGKSKGPVKFTSSQAYLNYRSLDNFYGGDDRDLPKSHNLVIAVTGVFGFYYLLFLRDDVDHDGGKALFQPLHETVPDIAIPLIQSAIAENKRFGQSTAKLEKKLEELMNEPEKHGRARRKLVEN